MAQQSKPGSNLVSPEFGRSRRKPDRLVTDAVSERTVEVSAAQTEVLQALRNDPSARSALDALPATQPKPDTNFGRAA